MTLLTMNLKKVFILISSDHRQLCYARLQRAFFNQELAEWRTFLLYNKEQRVLDRNQEGWICQYLRKILQANESWILVDDHVIEE